MIRKPFEQWLFEEVEIAFDPDRLYEYASLQQWLHVAEKAESLAEDFEEVSETLSKNVALRNKDELKMFFIAPFLLGFKFCK